MTPKMTRIWNNEMDLKGGLVLELRIDFDNDRHHAIRVAEPHETRQIADALIGLANQIMQDSLLQPNG